MCMGFVDNVEGKEGLCTMPCATDADCGADATCATLQGRQLCLRVCAADTDCLNGYTCVADPADPAEKACLVHPL